MYFLDAKRDRFGGDIYRVKNNFEYPLQRNKDGTYKVPAGSTIRVCMTSDFFLAEADSWRAEAWQIIKSRPDVAFYLLTKRPERVAQSLPPDWNDGWENVLFNVTTENQQMADARIPIMLELPFKHKGIMAAPFVGEISIKKYLASGLIESVWCDGENYDGARPLCYDWVKKLSDECKAFDVEFVFCGVGNRFIKDGKLIDRLTKIEQTKLAYDLQLNHTPLNPPQCKLAKLPEQLSLFETPAKKFFKPHCQYCPTKKFCFGCTNCGKCGQ